jgi:hypothetical protein
LKILIVIIFWSLSCFALLVEDANPEFLYVYVNYQNQKIDNYFLVVGLEKNKIKFSDIDSKVIIGLEKYLNYKKNEDGVFIFKTTPFCIIDLTEGKNVNYSFDSEYGDCRKKSTLQKTGASNFVFWYKKIYFICRDFVDWL